MIGRKLALVSNGQITEKEYIHPFVPDFQKIKQTTLEGFKKYGHISLVATLRYYIKSTNFLKNKYQEVKNIHKRNGRKNERDKQEISKFLKIISDYKQKIREIKHKIHEEEKNP